MEGASKRPEDETVEEWEHPLFMKALPSSDHPDAGTLEALSSLIYEDQTPEQLAEHFKNQGNEMVKAGPKYYRDALAYYTRALEQKSCIAPNNSVYYCNRAAVQLMLRNYNAVVLDCMSAIECSHTNIKAYIRAAKACNALDKWEEAIEFCKGGLQEEPNNKDLVAEAKKAEAIKAKIEKREQERKEAEEKREAENNKLLAVLKKKGIQMGAPSFNTQAYVKEGSEGELSRTVFVRDSGEVSLSVLFIYEEYKQTDFIKEFSLEETFIDHLAMMFPSLIYTPVSETGETVSVAPSPWDEKKDYLVENLLVYYETNWTQPLGSSTSQPLKSKKSKVKVDPRWTLGRVLRDSRYVVPGLPVFYIIPSRAEATFLRADLDQPLQ
ncbi:tetratricopeptide repeat domain containing protein [Acanthamoeba castellanii str. Neff]|uniref:Tetratricopeptide repeat domain containing protein n=1 Tax=Acanthamoeba castellanii (strain ATCC 30010 / Neff) TaxID=1257118 RepID=L8HCJ0_ACACF|nr:tetratricopeptide repeat domain containing protein [Acanthamoeba castellanii str. Neff]ELR22915.1 tetratricopeptide repeat domain containing protein [Acanthamoeba castellanii str. Neff]